MNFGSSWVGVGALAFGACALFGCSSDGRDFTSGGPGTGGQGGFAGGTGIGGFGASISSSASSTMDPCMAVTCPTGEQCQATSGKAQCCDAKGACCTPGDPGCGMCTPSCGGEQCGPDGC